MPWQPERSERAHREASSGAPRWVPLNLIFDYPVHWSRYKVLRDLIQNFYDSIPRHAWAEGFSHRIEQGRLTLVSEGVDFSYDWLVPIGASTKRDGDYAGYFGEGFKIAALCTLRDFGWTIEVRSRDWHLGVVTDTLDVDGRHLRRFLSTNIPPGLSSRPPSLSRQRAHGTTMHALPLREGGRESCAIRYVCFRQSLQAYSSAISSAINEVAWIALSASTSQNRCSASAPSFK